MKREVSSLRTEISRLRVLISSITVGVPINKVEVSRARLPPGGHKNSVSDGGSTFSSSATTTTSNYSGDWLTW